MLTCHNCGSRHVENKDLIECASCGRARRKAENTPLPTKRKPLRQVSEKMGVKLIAKHEAYDEIDAKSDGRCFSCGLGGGILDHSHILPQGNFEQHIANPLNIVLEHRYSCHSVWENKKADYAALFPIAWVAKLAIIKLLEPGYYALLQAKHPNLYP